MMRVASLRVTAFAAVFTILGAIAAVNAQTRGGSREQRPGAGPAQQWFEESGLKTGDLFPDVAVFDAQGKPFNTKSLKGQYTVLVNGCLT